MEGSTGATRTEGASRADDCARFVPELPGKCGKSEARELPFLVIFIHFRGTEFHRVPAEIGLITQRLVVQIHPRNQYLQAFRYPLAPTGDRIRYRSLHHKSHRAICCELFLNPLFGELCPPGSPGPVAACMARITRSASSLAPLLDTTGPPCGAFAYCRTNTFLFAGCVDNQT